MLVQKPFLPCRQKEARKELKPSIRRGKSHLRILSMMEITRSLWLLMELLAKELTRHFGMFLNMIERMYTFPFWELNVVDLQQSKCKPLLIKEAEGISLLMRRKMPVKS